MKPVFLLIPGFGSSEIWWEYNYDKDTHTVKHITFLDNLKKLGHIYKITFPWFNIDYYYRNPNKKQANIWKKIYAKYRPHTPNIDFTLEDLNYDNICKKLYTDIRKKYMKNKIIPIGHSYGGPIVYTFTQMYPQECDFCIVLDGSPLGKQIQEDAYDKFDKRYEKMIDKFFLNDDALYDILQKIKTTSDANNYIKKILDMIGFKSTVWKINHSSNNIKLTIPTLFFKSYYTNFDKDKKFKQMWNYWSKEESKINPKGVYYYFLDAPHFLWYDERCCDEIIKQIKFRIKCKNCK